LETVDEMADRLYSYTKKVLTSLRINGVDVAWVQIGNETRTGMIMTNSDGSATDVNGAMGPNYVKLHAAGCKAAKEIYPNCKTVVHFENGQNLANLTSSLNKLQENGAEYDVFGISLYPDFAEDNWYATYVRGVVNNLNTISEKYGCDVMVCEVGCDITAEGATAFLNDVVVRCQREVAKCKGVFYWEPECHNPGDGNWNGYGMGAFEKDGSPSAALVNAFGGKAGSVMIE
ncbi:arabinogalactan endo-1,4-beta-galactosidase, partial [Salmonella enterica]|nr:arabinogalactan endo-1,4-beta-galactosidase [Salmonella enterica]